VAFEVQDTGIGIAPDKTGRLFERFHQVDARISREYGGTGLGLTIAKQLTELMAGTIEVRSALGAGSTFTVRLPLPMAEEEHAAEAGPPLPAVAFPLRILVADDVSDNRMLLRLYLRDLAAELIFAKDGLEALAAATQERFDLILLDLHLPRKNGGEVIAALREHEARSGLSPTPVVVVSADEARNTIPGQAQIYFLPKPASRDEVIGAIHRHAQPLSPVARGTARLPESIVYLGQGMRELMPAFLGNRRRDLTNLREYLRLQEHDRLVELCHAFHGVTGSFGFAHASELSRELQLAVQNGELERAGLVVGQIEDFFRETKIVYT
jgi:CheY-like chemotaxis protein